MPDIMEILADLNVTIADMETLQADNIASLPANQSIAIVNDTKRAIGQLKAARTSIINARVKITGGTNA